jgi:hypothetical protein
MTIPPAPVADLAFLMDAERLQLAYREDRLRWRELCRGMGLDVPEQIRRGSAGGMS